jgi:hypothetical protein
MRGAGEIALFRKETLALSCRHERRDSLVRLWSAAAFGREVLAAFMADPDGTLSAYESKAQTGMSAAVPEEVADFSRDRTRALMLTASGAIYFYNNGKIGALIGRNSDNIPQALEEISGSGK